MKEILKSLLFRGSESTVVCECRRCGTVVAAREARCSCCGADEIVEYVID